MVSYERHFVHPNPPSIWTAHLCKECTAKREERAARVEHYTREERAARVEQGWLGRALMPKC